MYIFRRTTTVNRERVPEAMAFAVEIAATVKAVTGRQVNVFTALFGAPLGTVHWTSRVDSLADLADMTGALAADAGYLEKTSNASGLFATMPEDALVNIVSSSAVSASALPFYSSTQAVIANGKIAEAMAFGVKTQMHLAKTGLTTSFGTSMFGPYGGVGWLVGADTMAQLDSVQEFMATDAEFAAMLSEAGSLFVEGSGTNGLIQKIN